MTAPKWEATKELPNSERHHGDLLALDGSVRSPGLSLYRHGVLVAATRISVPKELESLPEAERWYRVAALCFAWWEEQNEGIGRTVRTLIYERPQWYSERQKKSKGDPNKLAHVLGVSQSLAIMFVMHNLQRGARPPELLSPTPAEWTGQVPKTDRNGKYPKDPRKSPRHSRVWGCLTPGEQAVLLKREAETGKLTGDLRNDANHDTFDGVGIGLFALGRYKAVRVFAGAT